MSAEEQAVGGEKQERSESEKAFIHRAGYLLSADAWYAESDPKLHEVSAAVIQELEQLFNQQQTTGETIRRTSAYPEQLPDGRPVLLAWLPPETPLDQVRDVKQLMQQHLQTLANHPRIEPYVAVEPSDLEVDVSVYDIPPDEVVTVTGPGANLVREIAIKHDLRVEKALQLLLDFAFEYADEDEGSDALDEAIATAKSEAKVEGE